MPTYNPPLVTRSKTIFAPTLEGTHKPPLVTRTKTIFAPRALHPSSPAGATGRSRRLAYVPRLDLAITAGPSYLSRGRQGLRPITLTDRSQADRIAAISQRAHADSTSFAWQSATASAQGTAPSESPNTSYDFLE